MAAIRNSYLLSRVCVWLNTGAMPRVTIVCSRIQVNELAYRTSRHEYELIARHIHKVDDLQAFHLDVAMLDQIRQAMAQLLRAVRQNSTRHIEQNKASSNWLFEPRQNGWMAMFDGQPGDVHAFHCWLQDLAA